MAEEHFGVIDASKCYTHHAMARIFGVADTNGRCSQFILNNMLKDGLPFVKLGRLYVVSGHIFNLWVQERSVPWEVWNSDTSCSGVSDADDSSAGGATNGATRGPVRVARGGRRSCPTRTAV